MVTLLSSILGFFGAMVPDILSLIRDRSDRKYEKDILELQLKQQALARSERLEEVRVRADTAEAQAIYKTWASGIAWVDALNGTVRPVLAYAFFLLYGLTKCLQYAELEGANALMLWGEEDQAIFAGIISFYFGQRAFIKSRR